MGKIAFFGNRPKFAGPKNKSSTLGKRARKSQFYDDLKESLQDVLDYKRGKIHLRSEALEIPEPPAQYKPKDIRKIREINNYSQGVFARILNVNIKTVQSWESGQRHPSHAALRLLEIIDKGIYRPDMHPKRN